MSETLTWAGGEAVQGNKEGRQEGEEISISAHCGLPHTKNKNFTLVFNAIRVRATLSTLEKKSHSPMLLI